MDEFINGIVADLKIELSATDDNFDETLLTVKVRNAVREVLQELGSSMMNADDETLIMLERYYSNIRNIALYDYNMVGAEFQNAVTESSTSRQYTDRNKLFSGIYPLSKF